MNVTLGVSGGIACYKAAEILRRLQDRGHDVTVLMTRNAAQFVTPLTFRALSGRKVYVEVFEGPRDGSDFDGVFDHIFLAQATDLFLIAPASANCIARLASGAADDFLTTYALACTAPLVLAPAMNTRMWFHPAVQANLQTLARRGARVIEPEEGLMACKTSGPGRLAEVALIVDFVDSLLKKKKDLSGKRVLVTAGPTIEPIDPVRYISNRSSGKMGVAIARAAQDRGAEVTLISGPTSLEFPGTIRVRTTSEMRDAVLKEFPSSDIVIKAAAPLDFRPTAVAGEKIKKASGLQIEFEPTPDILRELGQQKSGKILVGFAAETHNHLQYGLEKLRAKNLDLIVVNPVEGPDSGFDSDMNQATIVDASGNGEVVPLSSKAALAERILDRIVKLLTPLLT